MPPSFFLMAHSLAPYSNGTTNCETSPLSMTLTRSVKADRRRDPASSEPWATNERRWPGRRPSGPSEAPAWKDKIPFQTSSSEATAGTTDPSGGSGRLRFSSSKVFFVKKNTWITIDLEHTNNYWNLEHTDTWIKMDLEHTNIWIKMVIEHTNTWMTIDLEHTNTWITMDLEHINNYWN